MNILVTVKRVVDPYARVFPAPDGHSLDSGSAKFDINPFDEIAIEEAVRLKETGSASVTVVSIGRPESEEQLRKALAMGADRAILVESAAEWDSLSVAKELVEIVKAEAIDLVLMGKQATDDDNNQAGQMLASLLDWPQATFASKVILEGSMVTVVRETDKGGQTVQFSLPGLITADLRLNQPRYIAIPAIIKAKGKPLEKRSPVTQPSAKVTVTKFESPPKRESGCKLASVPDLADAILARGLLA